MDGPKKDKLKYFDYNKIVSIFFGSTEIAYHIYNLRKEEWEQFGSEVAACLFEYNLFESYDDYKLISIGEDANNEAKLRKGTRVFYVDKLSDKVEYLFNIEPNIKKPLKNVKDRLYQKAIVQYFEYLIEKKIYGSNSTKNRYLMTYPSHWTLEQAAYLRSLVQTSRIVNEHDHLDRLIMYNEGEAIIRYIQSPQSNFPNIREGQKYMICDLSGSKVEMHLYDIKRPINPQDEIKSTSRCSWYNGSIEEPAQIYIKKYDFFPESMLYLSSLLSTPSISITPKDLEGVLNKLFRDTLAWSLPFKLECLTEKDVEIKGSVLFNIPESLHDLYYERLNNLKKPITEPLPEWIEYRSIRLYALRIKKMVLKPACNRIIQYVTKIIETVTDIIDGIILVNSKENTCLMKLIADEYEKRTKRKMHQLYLNNITVGAVLKCLDNISVFDIYRPRIVHDDLVLSAKPVITNTQNVIILIDYELEKTRVSYIHTQPGQLTGDSNIKHIMDWPGQSTSNRDFPALNVILFPKYSINIGKDSKVDFWSKRDFFGNFSSRNSKAMFILQENNSHNQKFSTLANSKFYTFEKDEYGIILVTHQRKKKRKIVAKLLIATTANSTSSSYEITRKRISFQEFTLLYFEYLADFLHTYIYSKTGVEKDKYRYCITYDNYGYSEKFTLSNKDIRQIAFESNLISAHAPLDLLVLERAEASAIYCRKLIDTTMANDKQAHLYFLQVQLHPDRCLLILNTVPFLDQEDSNSYKENGRLWECVHKYAKTENILINFMDIILENLWIHMQNIGSLLLRKCEQHQTKKRFFNSKNMQIFKSMLYDYISTKKLHLEDSEKEHTVRMCDNYPSCCCYLVTTNMDLLEFAFNPAINQLVSIIQGSIFNQNLFQGIQINDIFVMGEFLNCQDYASYLFLEELLFAKLRNIQPPPFNSPIHQSLFKKTQVRKLGSREYQKGQIDIIEDRHDSLAQISLGGSIMFSIDPRNLLVERIAVRTYIINLVHYPSTKIVYNHPVRTLVDGGTYQIVILKGTPLNSLSLSLDEDTISKHFVMSNYYENEFYLDIVLLVAIDDNISELTDTNMEANNWLDKCKKKDFERWRYFPIFKNTHGNPSFPISFKFSDSHSERYKVWVEQGKNRSSECQYIREPILLKSCHNE